MTTVFEEFTSANSGALAEAYWKHVDGQVLALQRCLSCNQTQSPPRGHCRSCLSDHTRLEQWDGQAIVHSFSVMNRAAYPHLEPYVPYCVALVDLGEGNILESWIVDHEDGELVIGAPLTLDFRVIGDRLLPVFRLAPTS